MRAETDDPAWMVDRTGILAGRAEHPLQPGRDHRSDILRPDPRFDEAKTMIALNVKSPQTAVRDGRKHDGSGPSLSEIHQIVTRLRLVTAPSRQKILLLLASGEHNVGDICEELGNPSQPAVSHQLSLLRHGRLIECQRRGRNVFYRLTESGQSVARAYEVLGNSRACARNGTIAHQ